MSTFLEAVGLGTLIVLGLGAVLWATGVLKGKISYDDKDE